MISIEAIQPRTLYLRPSVHGPGTNRSPMRSRNIIGLRKARTTPMTQTDTTARNAIGTPGSFGFSYRAGRVSTAPTTVPAMIALAGVPLLVTFDHNRQPGTARSRLNAYVIRDIEVTQLMPQKN